MLVLVISTPRPDHPSAVRSAREQFWGWIDPLLTSGMARFCYPRAGRGVVALFDVDSNETLHRLLNEWSEIIPAGFDLYPLIDTAAARAFLKTQP